MRLIDNINSLLGEDLKSTFKLGATPACARRRRVALDAELRVLQQEIDRLSA